uniref:BTB domain-containing protein n=1 Tax=Caenorhabditis tropicalis TaxID=1561998 RepID=A0A1I7U043_9PELO
MATAILNLPTTSTRIMVGGQECDLTLTIAKLNFNGTNYLGLEVKYNHYLPPGSSCEYTTEVNVMNKRFNLKHYRFNNDRLYLPTFMKWDDVVVMADTETSVHCSARVIGFKRFENVERRISDRSYHGTNNLRNVRNVDLTIIVGKYKLLINKDYLMAMSGFFGEILQNADKYSTHNDVHLTESRDDAFVTMIDICHHKFWCNYDLKDDLWEIAHIYQFPFVIEFHKRFFNTDQEAAPLNADKEFSMERTLDKDLSRLLTRHVRHS